MRINLLRMLSIMLIMTALMPVGWAKPEQLRIKDPAKRMKQKSAEGQLKNIDLQNIEDPEARKAIGEILNYLNLETKR